MEYRVTYITYVGTRLFDKTWLKKISSIPFLPQIGFDYKINPNTSLRFIRIIWDDDKKEFEIALDGLEASDRKSYEQVVGFFLKTGWERFDPEVEEW